MYSDLAAAETETASPRSVFCKRSASSCAEAGIVVQVVAVVGSSGSSSVEEVVFSLSLGKGMLRVAFYEWPSEE